MNIHDTEIFKVKNEYNNQPISISGPSAVGKSTVGQMLAKEINTLFFDLDEEVAATSGFKTTQEVIRTFGHDQFKIIQHNCLKRLLENNLGKYVLASGGEIIRPGYDQQIINANRALIHKFTYNICLYPSQDLDECINVLFPRLHDGKRDTKTTGETIEEFRAYIDVFNQYADLADAIIFTHTASLNAVMYTTESILQKSY